MKISVKHIEIGKTNNFIMLVAAIASIITIFSLISAKALVSQSAYQRKVLAEKSKAVKQLKDNVNAANTLKSQYDVFESGNPNIIGGQGGSNPGNGPSDGDNARIVLDALPSQYDFPALTSSLERIMTNDHVAIQSIGGTDQGSTTTSTSSSDGKSQAIVIAFSGVVLTDYATSQNLIKDFERSIRPVDITNLTLAGSSSAMTITLQANTYYQPGVSLTIGQKVLK